MSTIENHGVHSADNPGLCGAGSGSYSSVTQVADDASDQFARRCFTWAGTLLPARAASGRRLVLL